MQIGKPQRVIVVEPLVMPEPLRREAPEAEPERPVYVPEREPEKVPVP